MLVMEHDITVGRWRVAAVDCVKIRRSVETLSDTAEIVLPGTCINTAADIEGKLSAGDAVEVRLGYGGDLKTEFTGYLKSIKTDDGSLTLECEDALWMWRAPLGDVQHSGITLKRLLQKVCDEVNAHRGANYSIDCDYDFEYEKFTICSANATDVLRQVQDETKANIYFDGSVLHVHAPYSRIGNERTVVYDFAVNVEKSDLKYVRKEDRDICVEVTYHMPNGKKETLEVGGKKGDKICRTVNVTNEASAKKAAESEYSLWNFDGYEGSLTGWLVPYVEPAYKVTIRDGVYPEKEGTYYVISTAVEFSASGGVRKVTLGRRI